MSTILHSLNKTSLFKPQKIPKNVQIGTYKYRVTVRVHVLSHAHGNPSYLIVTDVGLVNTQSINKSPVLTYNLVANAVNLPLSNISLFVDVLTPYVDKRIFAEISESLSNSFKRLNQ